MPPSSDRTPPPAAARPSAGPRRLPLALALGGALALAGCAVSGVRADAHAAAPDPTAGGARALPSGAPAGAESPAAWYAAGAGAAAARRGDDAGEARNVVLFIGDGMSQATVAAARILHGQRAGRPGEESVLSFEAFPATALSKTYNTDLQTPDSAGTMTAMATGVKTRAGVIGVDQRVVRGTCADVEAAARPSLVALAERAGLATGIVTTTRITHATPASLYAHSPDRNWEADVAVPEAAAAAGCTDIAAQLVAFDEGDGIEVVLGGGAGAFRTAASGLGVREDGRDLVEEWRAARPRGHWVEDAASLAALPADGAPVLGLFAADHLAFEADREAEAPSQPSLAAMTRAAITRLQATGKPFVLVVEAGRIDHAHHHGRAQRALRDTIALHEAVAAAEAMTSADDTLVAVTADHAHTLHFAGYPARGNPILGLVRGIDGELARDADGRPYTTLGYANGPGHENAGVDLEHVDVQAIGFRQPALVPLGDETHGGDDVAVYARGPGSEAVRGVFEQHVLFHLLLQAQPALRAAQAPPAD